MTTPDAPSSAGPSAAPASGAPAAWLGQPVLQPGPVSTPADVEQHLEKTQEIAGEIQAQLAEPASAQEKSHLNVAPELKELDQSLAEDIDDLLQGDFESIDAVLNEVIDDPPSQGASALSDQPGEPAEPMVVDVTAEVAASALNAAPTADVAKSIAPPAAAAHPTAAESKPIASAAPSTPAQPASAGDHSLLPQSKPANQSRAKPKRSISEIAMPLQKGLAMVNLPLRFVPQGLLPIVNITAMSLPLWAVLVWATVIMNRGVGVDDQAISAAQPPKPTLHKESSSAAAAESHTAKESAHAVH